MAQSPQWLPSKILFDGSKWVGSSTARSPPPRKLNRLQRHDGRSSCWTPVQVWGSCGVNWFSKGIPTSEARSSSVPFPLIFATSHSCCQCQHLLLTPPHRNLNSPNHAFAHLASPAYGTWQGRPLNSSILNWIFQKSTRKWTHDQAPSRNLRPSPSGSLLFLPQ